MQISGTTNLLSIGNEPSNAGGQGASAKQEFASILSGAGETGQPVAQGGKDATLGKLSGETEGVLPGNRLGRTLVNLSGETEGVLPGNRLGRTLVNLSGETEAGLPNNRLGRLLSQFSGEKGDLTQTGNVLPDEADSLPATGNILPGDLPLAADASAKTIPLATDFLSSSTIADPVAAAQPALDNPLIAPLPANPALPANPPGTAEVAAQGEGEAGAESEGLSEQYAPARSRPANPVPAELEARRANAPASVTWEFTEELGQKTAVPRADLRARNEDALGQVQLDMVSKQVPLSGEQRREIELSNGLKLRSAAMLQSLSTSSAGETSTKIQIDGSVPGALDSVAGLRSAGNGVTSSDFRAAQGGEMAALVDRLVEARVQARADRNQIDLAHPDFGRVTLAVSLGAGDRLAVDMPGAPSELRQAVSQGLNQNMRGDTGGSGQGAPSSSASSAQGEGREGRGNPDGRANERDQQGRTRNQPAPSAETPREGRRGILA